MVRGDVVAYVAAAHQDAVVSGVVLNPPRRDTPNSRVKVRCELCGGVERPYLREMRQR